METEELKITDKNGLITKNVCSNCNRLLNVSPVYSIYVNNIPQKICGRCTHIVNNFNGKKYRQNTFEDLAAYLTYPCSNKQYGCNSVFPWDNVMAHETVCKFQYMPCLFSFVDLFPGTECIWKGNVRNIEEHIENTHKDCLIHSSQIILSFEGLCKNKLFFTYVAKKLVAIVLKFETPNKYYCLLMINGNDLESQCYQYQLELFSNDNKGKSIILRKHRLEPLGCLTEHLKNVDRMLEIDLNQIQSILTTSQNIYGSFGIVKKNKKLRKQITGKDIPHTKDKVLPLDESVLQELECPVCNQYMIAKIYICQAGHSICSSCKDRVATCPICRSESSKTRNYTLEKLTSKIHYPCRNREIGCSYVTTADKIRTHEAVCELSETHCLLGCGYKCLRPRMYNHILEKHPHQMLELDVTLKQDVFEKKHVYYILCYNEDIFRFSMGINNELKINFQHLGTIEDEQKYRYQMEFIDPSTYGRSLSMSFFCQSLTEYPEQANKTATSLPWDLLKPFHDGRYLHYRVSLFKI